MQLNWGKTEKAFTFKAKIKLRGQSPERPGSVKRINWLNTQYCWLRYLRLQRLTRNHLFFLWSKQLVFLPSLKRAGVNFINVFHTKASFWCQFFCTKAVFWVWNFVQKLWAFNDNVDEIDHRGQSFLRNLVVK